MTAVLTVPLSSPAEPVAAEPALLTAAPEPAAAEPGLPPGLDATVARVIPLPLRIVPAPISAPPYDDELDRTGAPALRLVPPLAPPPAPARFDDDAWLAAERTPSAELPSAEHFARRIVQVLVEVVAGVRPVTQLRRDTTPELYASLRATVLCRPKSHEPRPTGRAIRSVHVQVRPEGVAEACATVRRAGRVTAVALRLEGVEGRWRCTELEGASRV